MIDAFHVKSPVDGITRGLNEHYDSKQDVQQDPYGAWLAIQNLWNGREELEAENARLREAQAWQPIETAPKDGTEICAWVGSGYKGGWLQLSWYKVNGLAAWRDWDQDTWQPTHWMPISEPQESSNFPEKVQLDDAK